MTRSLGFRLILIFALCSCALGLVLLSAFFPPAVKLSIAGAVVVVGIMALFATVRSHLHQVDSLTEVAKRIAEGDTSARARTDDNLELGALAASLNLVGDALRRKSSLYAAEQEQAEEILSVMADGVLVLDETCRIVRANGAASYLLRAPLQKYSGRRIVEAVRDFPAIELTTRALAAQESFEEKLELAGPRYLSAQVVPLREAGRGQDTADDRGPAARGGRAARQVLFILHDETEAVVTERMRKDFAANVSHELKTPLAGLTLLADTLQHAISEDPAQAVNFAARLSAEIHRLSELVSDLLTLAGLEQTTTDSTRSFSRLDLASVAEEAVREVSGYAETQGLSLGVATNPAPVYGDHVQLAAAIRNLLNNAIRFTDRGGAVLVQVEGGPDTVQVSVQDNGIGIPRSQQSRIFERFYRVDKARSRETGGTGLGLSIVKHIVELHGGTVTVQSTVGVGSTFTIRLPAAQDLPMSSPAERP